MRRRWIAAGVATALVAVSPDIAGAADTERLVRVLSPTQNEGVFASGAKVRVVVRGGARLTVWMGGREVTDALRLRNGSTNIGVDSAPLAAGQVYRVGLRQRRGAGANGVLEAFVAAGDAPFGAPFATITNGSWSTAADRLRVGATISATLSATFDDIRIATAAMPRCS